MTRLVTIALALSTLLGAQAAYAGDNDFVLHRLANRMTDGNGQTIGVVPQNLEFRSFASQLGVALAPTLLAPADTLGFGGFSFAFQSSSTTIDKDAAYWRVRRGSDATGNAVPGNTPGSLSTLGFFASKGIWFPLPSFELGAGANYLLDSSTLAAVFSAKFALHEGYHDLPIPSIAVRASVSRMLNQKQLDLTVPSIDVVLSKHIGVAGTWSIDPFAGWNMLLIVPRSEVIDATPHIDQLADGNQMDAANSFVFSDQDVVIRQRITLGAKLKFSKVAITAEAKYAFAGNSVDDRPNTTSLCSLNSTTTNCDAKDSSESQLTLAIAAGLDF